MKVRLDADGATITARATASVKGPSVPGDAIFTEYGVGTWRYVHLRLELSGDPAVLRPGLHGVHIHEKGECEGFKCAGGHFDPGPSGNADVDANHGYHAGDLPNILIDDSGSGVLEAITTRVTPSDGPVSILQPEEGSSLMVHGNPDPTRPARRGLATAGVRGSPADALTGRPDERQRSGRRAHRAAATTWAVAS